MYNIYYVYTYAIDLKIRIIHLSPLMVFKFNTILNRFLNLYIMQPYIMTALQLITMTMRLNSDMLAYDNERGEYSMVNY